MSGDIYNIEGCNIAAIGDEAKGKFLFNGTDSPLTSASLQSAILSIKEKMGESDELREFIDDLMELTTTRNRKVIGLENKLHDGNRDDLIEDAIYLKNKFERKVAKNQLFISEQKVYVQTLAFICTVFNNKILPLIRENQTKKEIDSEIFDKIINEVHKALIHYDNTFTTELVRGMLFYLTGKCHLIWR